MPASPYADALRELVELESASSRRSEHDSRLESTSCEPVRARRGRPSSTSSSGWRTGSASSRNVGARCIARSTRPAPATPRSSATGSRDRPRAGGRGFGGAGRRSGSSACQRVSEAPLWNEEPSFARSKRAIGVPATGWRESITTYGASTGRPSSRSDPPVPKVSSGDASPSLPTAHRHGRAGQYGC